MHKSPFLISLKTGVESTLRESLFRPTWCWVRNKVCHLKWSFSKFGGMRDDFCLKSWCKNEINLVWKWEEEGDRRQRERMWIWLSGLELIPDYPNRCHQDHETLWGSVCVFVCAGMRSPFAWRYSAYTVATSCPNMALKADFTIRHCSFNVLRDR